MMLYALERMGITELANRCVDELSGGQRQRVWIALALAQETDILLLDEPTTYLDIAYQVEILDLLTELNRRKGTTIVMILHDVNLSARYADHLFALCRGELIAEGKPADLFQCIFCTTLHAEIVNDEQGIAAELVHNIIAPGKAAVQLVQDSGKVCHAHRHLLFHQSVRNAPGKETLSRSYTAPEKKPKVL